MSDLILGLHAGANASAAIGSAGQLLYCVQEKRLTGIKGYMGLPRRAITACLEYLGAKPEDVTQVAYGSRSGPVDHCSREEFQRRLRRFHQRPDAARAEARLAAGRPDTLPERLRTLLDEAGVTAPVAFYDHHTTHAATAYYGLRDDPDRPYLVLTCDGFGDGACATVSVWRGGRPEEIARTRMRDSPGLLYFWATHAYGFTPHEDEYKLMGIAPYADPDRVGQIAELLHQYLWLDDSGLRFQRATGPSIERSWPRIEARLRGRRFDDIFGGLQRFTEDLLTAWVAAAVQATGIGRILAAGGVFMNARPTSASPACPTWRPSPRSPPAVTKASPSVPSTRPAPPRVATKTVQPLADCYLGDDITDQEASNALAGTSYTVERPDNIDTAVAKLLAEGQIVARCAGRMEFGARALGNRSILADPHNADLPRVLTASSNDATSGCPSPQRSWPAASTTTCTTSST